MSTSANDAIAERRLHFYGDGPDTAPPSKLDLVRSRPADRRLFVHVDARSQGVDVPAIGSTQPLLFEIGPGINELILDDVGMTGALPINGQMAQCRIPWSAVFAIIAENDRGLLWPESAPPDFTIEREPSDVPRSKGLPILVHYPKYVVVNGTRVSDRWCVLTVDGREVTGVNEITWATGWFSARGTLRGEFGVLLDYVAAKRSARHNDRVALLLRCRIGEQDWTVQFEDCAMTQKDDGTIEFRAGSFYHLKVGPMGNPFKGIAALLRGLLTGLQRLFNSR